jgi:hypothetical protein
MTESPNAMTELDTLIKQAEIMQKKMQMDVQFKKNIAFLKKSAPAIYEKMNGFEPKKLVLQVHGAEEINLVNIDSKNPVYKKDPVIFAKEQVYDHLLSAARFNIQFKKTEIVNEKHIHPISVNQALESYESLHLESRYNPKNPIGLALIIGCGLGYHIEELVKNCDVRNLVVYDRIDDGFYASLFTIDWENIVTNINKKNGKVKIYTGNDHNHALREMRGLSYEIGMHNMVTHRVYKHTESTDNDLFYEAFKIEFPIQISSLGFYDDEQVSFSHTIHNINSNEPIFTPKKHEDLPPVFIIGNGPSLDSLVDTIRKYAEHAIIFSCGSALTTLYSLGIKPDLHIEVERNLGVAEMISFGTDKEYTKNIPLLAVNNLAPDVKKLFKKTYLAIKPNDLGASILADILSPNDYFELELCNPTVTNCGFSYAVHMGFKEIYLMATDYGMPDKKSHHSSHSIWKKMDEKREKNQELEQDAIEDYTYSSSQFETKGNFSEKVITSPILNTSKINIEILIRENPNANYYNPNNGAYIEGAKPTLINEISIKNPIKNKTEVINALLTRNFTNFTLEKITRESILERYISPIEKIKGALILSEKCLEMKDLHDQLDRIFNNLQKLTKFNSATPMLIRGSFQVQAGMLIYNCSRTKTQSEFLECYKAGKNIYNDFITTVIERLSKDPLALDDTLSLKPVTTAQ